MSHICSTTKPRAIAETIKSKLLQFSTPKPTKLDILVDKLDNLDLGESDNESCSSENGMSGVEKTTVPKTRRPKPAKKASGSGAIASEASTPEPTKNNKRVEGGKATKPTESPAKRRINSAKIEKAKDALKGPEVVQQQQPPPPSSSGSVSVEGAKKPATGKPKASGKGVIAGSREHREEYTKRRIKTPDRHKPRTTDS